MMRKICFSGRLTCGAGGLPADHPDIAVALHNLARLYEKQGRLEEAEALCKEAIQAFRLTIGEEHPLTVPLSILWEKSISRISTTYKQSPCYCPWCQSCVELSHQSIRV